MATARDVDIAQAETELETVDLGQEYITPSIKKSETDSAQATIRVSQDSTDSSSDDGTYIDEKGNRLLEPTEEEARTLRRVADKIPYAAFSVVVVELCERFAFYGLSGPFQNYLQNGLPAGGSGTGAPPRGSTDPPGALGQGQTTAVGLQNMFSFLAYIMPIAGAIVADAKWGRYKTITVFCLVYFCGLLIITLTSIPSSLAHGGGLPGWIVGALIVATGTGGIKANVSPLVADQYRKTKPFIRVLPKTGERVIVDPNLTITRIYNLFYWCINVGSLSSIATTESERHVGFWLAYLLPTAIFLFTPVILVISRNQYYKVPPKGSIVVEVWRAVMLAVSGSGWWKNPFKAGRADGGIWKWAKPSTYASLGAGGKGEVPRNAKVEKRVRGMTWDDTFVDEVKRTLRACQIFLFYPLYWISYNQITTNLVSQAATMKLNGTPNDLIQNFDPIALIILIPIMDIFVYPTLQRYGFVARPIFKIWLGFMFGTLAMIYSAVLQHYIYTTNPCGEFPSGCAAGPSTISVWVQVPAYVLIAISEIFASITGLEYAYNKAPRRMKSVVVSIFLFMTAIGNAINAALSPVAEDPKLVWNYTGIACATFIAGNLFYFFYRKRDTFEEEENAIGKVVKDGSSSDVALTEKQVKAA